VVSAVLSREPTKSSQHWGGTRAPRDDSFTARTYTGGHLYPELTRWMVAAHGPRANATHRRPGLLNGGWKL